MLKVKPWVQRAKWPVLTELIFVLVALSDRVYTPPLEWDSGMRAHVILPPSPPPPSTSSPGLFVRFPGQFLVPMNIVLLWAAGRLEKTWRLLQNTFLFFSLIGELIHM